MAGKPPQLLSDEQLLNEASNNLLNLLANPDLMKDIRINFLSLSLLLRQDLAKKLLEIIKANNESVSSFLVTKKGMRLPPTAANWLKDFIQFAGVKADKHRKEEYLKALETEAKFPGDTQIILKNLFEGYVLLEEVAIRPESLETVVIKDKTGRLKVWQAGELTDFSPALPLSQERITAPPPLPPFPVKEEKPVFAPPLAEEKEPRPISFAPEVSEEQEGPETGEGVKKEPASFSYQPEDEEEIRNHEKILSSYELPQTYDEDEVIKKIIADNNLTFTDEILEKRFYSIAQSRLKEIRNEIEVADLLTRSSKIGGLEYSADLAQKIIEDLNQAIPGLQKVKPAAPAAPTIPIPTPKEALMKTLAEKKIIKPAEEEQEMKEEIKEEKPFVSPRMPQAPIPTQKQVLFEKAIRRLREEEDFRKIREAEVISPLKIQRPPGLSEKPRLEDIKGKAKILGPVEELRALSLNDFRRLGTEKLSAVRKIYDKINLLKEDTFARFAAGIKAWRESEVYQLYLEMGLMSLEKSKNIREIIEERANNGQPYLTEKEFNDIVDLNKRIRF